MRSRHLALGAVFAAAFFGCIQEERPDNVPHAQSLECVDCHEADRDTSTVVDHRKSSFPVACAQCHGQEAWKPATFDHSAFVLTGAHERAECSSCHVATQVGPLPLECLGCHADDRDTPTFPDHKVAAFPTDCARCHTTEAWQPAAFEHEAYPLTGQHATALCASCHNEPSPRPTTCIGCHAAEQQAVDFPDHLVSGFPTECTDCHTTAGWTPALFDHDDYFVLLGAHTSLQCSSCHNQPSPRPTTCIGCHENDRNRPVLPDHRTGGFPEDCAQCHTNDEWVPALFDHDAAFPLTGRHRNLSCVSCHAEPSPRPTDCVGCHEMDRSIPVRPDHYGAGISTECTSCHSTSGWIPAFFDHGLYFPLNGDHDQSCSSCHLDTNDSSVVSCIDCHDHRQSKMDDVHNGENGYTWTTPACLRCHPDGNN